MAEKQQAAKIESGDRQPVRWRRRKDARPQEILEAALALFAEKGFAATRMDDIAERADRKSTRLNSSHT